MALTPDQYKELAKTFAANRAVQEALNKKRRMESGELDAELVPGSDDPAQGEPAYQIELQRFFAPLRDAGISYKQRAIAMDAVDAHGYPLGEFALELVKTVGPVLSAAFTGWIAGRSGRKVRVKFQDVEVEARTPQEVEALIKEVLTIKERLEASKTRPDEDG